MGSQSDTESQFKPGCKIQAEAPTLHDQTLCDETLAWRESWLTTVCDNTLHNDTLRDKTLRDETFVTSLYNA